MKQCKLCQKWITTYEYKDGKICGVCYMLRQAQGLDQ